MVTLNSRSSFIICLLFVTLGIGHPTASAKEGSGIIHDAEYYILKAQNGKKWAAEDKVLDQKLADLRKKNGGKPPNIVYLLWDDTAFGAVGFPALQKNFGYETPHLNRMASVVS